AKAVKNTVKKLKKTKRYNGVYDPEYEPFAETALYNEMTGAVPSAPKSSFEEESLENLASGINFSE
ncbi:MAG TPA: hypothetical protein DEO32_04370, partial [Ruminococcaceae bacterium]|nr:hypothetical protein [Oscillospiraceae bacterium]